MPSGPSYCAIPSAVWRRQYYITALRPSYRLRPIRPSGAGQHTQICLKQDRTLRGCACLRPSRVCPRSFNLQRSAFCWRMTGFSSAFLKSTRALGRSFAALPFCDCAAACRSAWLRWTDHALLRRSARAAVLRLPQLGRYCDTRRRCSRALARRRHWRNHFA